MRGEAQQKSSLIHENYARYVWKHGTTAERSELREDIQFMRELRGEFSQSRWEPMDDIVLIDYLMEMADEIAQRRFATARKQRYGDYQGKVGRSLDEERQTVRGHLAAQVMLGLELGKPDTKEEARVHGNIGGNNEAFVPIHNPLQHHLIVDPRTPDHLISWLVIPYGERHFHLAGWLRSGAAKKDHFRKEKQREGGTSVAYWIHPTLLHSVQEWWDERD